MEVFCIGINPAEIQCAIPDQMKDHKKDHELAGYGHKYFSADGAF